MILGYKKKFPWGTETNFKRKILDGTKKHTMREDSHDRWHAGKKIQHAHGVRTKQYDHFADGECKSTQKVSIQQWDPVTNDNYYVYFKNMAPFKRFVVKVDDRVLSIDEICQLSHNDGFDLVHDFFRWFFDGFEGKIIHFTDLKY